jgi:hypothetical protein
MKHLVTIPNGWADYLRRQEQTDLGYQVVSVDLKDGRTFGQAIVSEGCVMPFQAIPKASAPPNPFKYLYLQDII